MFFQNQININPKESCDIEDCSNDAEHVGVNYSVK